jgi:hypothetical protein
VTEVGAPLRDVQDYAGHKDPRTTRRYDHSRDGLDRNAVLYRRCLPGLMTPPTKRRRTPFGR